MLDLNTALGKIWQSLKPVKCAENEIVVEVEAGVVGGEEDGAAGSRPPDEDLYTLQRTWSHCMRL